MFIITVYLSCMSVVRCVPDESFMIRVMCLVMHDTHTCGMVELSGTTICAHMPIFRVFIDSNVQSITYYLFAYVLSHANKIIEQ